MKNISVAIDGPAAAGKSTVAKAVAKKLGYIYVDTGAMYRAFTYYVISHNIDPKDEKASCECIKDVHITLAPNEVVLLNGEDVSKVIRTPLVSGSVSYIASYKDIRLFLVDEQRALAKGNNVVMDGRDIGTYVLPNAEVKIFQIASVETRAQRRYKENIEKNIPCTYEEIVEDVKTRDRIDSSRAFAPLKPAEDSIELDTSNMTIEESVNAVLKIIEEKTK